MSQLHTPLMGIAYGGPCHGQDGNLAKKAGNGGNYQGSSAATGEEWVALGALEGGVAHGSDYVSAQIPVEVG